MAYSRQITSDIVWRGVYNAANTYYSGDWVTYNGQMYRAVTQTSGAPQATNQSDSVPSLGSTNAALWQTNGNASNTGTGEVRLTPAANNQTGSTFYKTPVSLLHNLTISFQSECSGGSGADGYSLSLLDTRYNSNLAQNYWQSLGSGGFVAAFETYSGSPPYCHMSYRDASQATPTTTQFANISETTANLRAVSNWVFTFTRTAPNTFTLNVTKGGTTYGASPYTGIFVSDSSYIGFTGATGGANDNQYIRNFSAVSSFYQAWEVVNTTVFSGAGAPQLGNYDPNTLYIQTGVNLLYYWNGSAWTAIGNADTSWNNLTLNSPFTSGGGGNWPGPQYRKMSNGMVALRGVVTVNGGGAVVIGTLPAGYRPSLYQAFPLLASNTGSDNVIGYMTVQSGGGLNLLAPVPGTSFQLDGITFLAEQ